MFLREFSYCSPDVKCCMLKSFWSTMYCPSMWYDSTVTSMKKLKIAYNNGLRRILNLPKYNSASEMFVNLNIPSFNELLRKFVYSFKSRIQDSCNSLVNGIVKGLLCHYLVRYGPGGVIFSTHNCYNNYSCVWEWTSCLVQHILLYSICNSMYVVCMWRVSSTLLLYLLDLESVNKKI